MVSRISPTHETYMGQFDPEMELREIGTSPPAAPEDSVKEAIALIEKDPDKAMNCFNQLLNSPNLLSPSHSFDALVGRARACLLRPIPSNLQCARQDLLDALELLEEPGLLILEIPQKKAEALKYLAEALAAAPEDSVKEAIALTEQNPNKAMNCFNQLLNSPSPLSPSHSFDALVGRARACLLRPIPPNLQCAREDLLNALKLLEKPDSLILEFPRKKGEVLKYLAQVHIREGKLEEARSYFQEGLKVYKNHGKLTLDYIDFLNKTCKKPEEALQVCDQVIAMTPKHSDFLYARAKIHFAAGNWAKAHQDCVSYLKNEDILIGYRKEILDIAKEACVNAEDHENLCKHMQEACRLETSLKEQVARSKELLDARLLSINISVKMSLERWSAIEKSPEAALEVFQQLLKLHRYDGDLLIGQALAWIALKREESYSSARQNLEQALPLVSGASPDAADASLNKKGVIFHLLAQLCLRENKREEALRHFRDAYQTDKNRYFSAYIAFLYDSELKGKEQEMLELCEQAIQHNPQNKTAVYWRAKVYFSLDKLEELSQDCSFLLAFNAPKSQQVEILELVSKAQMKIGAYPAAYGSLLKAYELDVSSRLLERFKKLVEIEALLESEQTSKRRPFRQDLSHLLKAALQNENSRDAIKLFDHILLSRDQLSPADLYQALVKRALCCIRTKENLSSARDNLQGALSLLPTVFPEEIRYKKPGLLRYLASIDNQEKNPPEALKKLKQAWSLMGDKEVLQEYCSSLIDQNQFKEALKLLDEACRYNLIGTASLLFRQLPIFFAAKDWNSVIGNCERLLKTAEYNDGALFKIHNYAAAAYVKIGDYQAAERHAEKACTIGESDQVPNFFERLKNLLNVKKMAITETHLRQLPTADSCEYANLLLKTYQEELEHHPAQHVRFLFARARLLSQEEKFDQATLDYKEISAIFLSKPSFFPKEERSRIKTEFELHSKQHVEALLQRGQREDSKRVLNEHSAIAKSF